MSDKHYWYGYLEAGEKSSPVLQDHRLDTGSADTMYLYNHKRGEILEYKRAIIEPKLRALTPQEQELCRTLKSAYTEARAEFTPRGGKPVLIPARGGKPTPAANDEPQEEVAEAFADEDGWLEEEEA